jgi:hypothetical protein
MRISASIVRALLSAVVVCFMFPPPFTFFYAGKRWAVLPVPPFDDRTDRLT